MIPSFQFSESAERIEQQLLGFIPIQSKRRLLLRRIVGVVLMGAMLLAGPALADDHEDDLFREGDEIEQVIPPVVVNGQVDPNAAEPLNLDEIQITTMTPADRFMNATTPLVVALMFGSVGLVVYTLATQGRGDS